MMDFDTAALEALERLTTRPSPVRIAVIGDVMLDQFLYGAVARISPEAPVPVVDVTREVFRLGGAANVVHNLRVLGSDVHLLGVVGVDAMADRIREELEALGLGCEGLIAVHDRPTAIKTRVIAQHQQVVRFDREKQGPVSHEVVEDLVGRLGQRLPELDAVVVSDYGKGVVTERLMAPLVEQVRDHRTLLAVDPKPGNWECYRGADVITPNTKETEEMSGFAARSDEAAARAGHWLLEQLETRAILVTRGEMGATLVEREGDVTHIPTRARDVFDVTGAGDTTISVLTLARAAGADLKSAACLANLAAGVVVGKLGTAVVSAAELRDAAEHGIGPGSRASRI